MPTIVTLICSYFLVALAITTPVLSLTGFSIDIIHRDSPNSPLYDPSLSHSQRVVHALQRSTERIKHLHTLISRQSLISSTIIPSSGDFTIRFSIGTPPLEIVALVDTGSDIFWTECAPQQNTRTLFNPKNSSTYKPISCNSSQCQSLETTSCHTTANTCQYMSMYLDTPSRVLDLGTDIIALEHMSVPDTIFGCGQNVNDLTNFTYDWSGVVGLGGGPLSLISQTGSSMGSKFSYCLAHEPSGKSTINFGITGEFSGTGVVTTPMVQKSPNTFYYVSLQGISISNRRLDGHGSAGAEFTPRYLTQGNMIIDSVSLVTTIPSSLYQWLDYTLRYEMNLVIVPDPTHHQNLCFSTAEAWSFPVITLKFKNADLNLNPSNYFVETGQSVLCLAIRSTNSDVGILGNLAQRNLLVGYDLENKTVSFKPGDCSSR